MAISAYEEDAYEEYQNDDNIETTKRGRPARKLYWRSIEDYWERRRLQRELEDVFFQSTDSEAF
ncbi:MAG: DUF3545 family protein [Gammaproteobacteria bacterium]|nr:DUF3545 family protein [Gammaproteobacteria bacterium]